MNDQDIEHLRLLSIFHYVLAGITAFFACFPLIHVAVGFFMLIGALAESGDAAPPAFFGLLFMIIGLVFVTLGWALAIAMVLCAQRLRDRRAHNFCTVVAAIECIMMPLGTVLGVFTILVLQRPAVRAAFQP